MSDLSKTFDCSPYNILIKKLYHYRFTTNSWSLIQDYLSRRYERVKIQNVVSSWELLSKVSQASIIGSLCFNFYIKELLLLFENENIISSNYADDSTVTIIESTKDEVVYKLKYTVKFLASWFKNNIMKANIDKFQMMIYCTWAVETKMLMFWCVMITSENTAKLLGKLVGIYSAPEQTLGLQKYGKKSKSAVF